ncbi:MAG: hypothetical protein A3F17_00375 [Gammaproteobacteria bacterium RIFCSPHIGHO2_12_FULL_41_15]|nr:MAG: hypothetical protein A3F17_00375 [Gammaproteobacteria bacterium RIFCSPHIGHO2_12_FULL_41_15]
MLSFIVKKRCCILACLLLLSGCAGTRPKIEIPATQPPPPKFAKRPQVVVVLGSGGARGYAHLGVLQALKEAHIPIDGLVCASVGCVVGALYADSRSVKKAYRIMMQAGFWNFADVANTPGPSGLMTGYHLEKYLLANMRARNFGQLKIPLLIATTDLLTGHSYLIQGGPIAPAVLASAALPGVVRPIQLYGRVLIDGGVSAPVPVKFAALLRPKAIIAINIARNLFPKIPSGAYSIYSRAYQIMWLQLTDLSQSDADVVIRPYVGDAGTFDMGQRYQLYLEGLKAGKEMIPTIKKMLQHKNVTLTSGSAHINLRRVVR